MASAARIAEELDVEIAQAIRALEDAEMKEIGEAAINVIVLRTKSGLDADRKPFAQYSEGYKKERERLGRSSSTVDLAVTGHMQQAIDTEVSGDEVTLGFLNPNEEKKAAIHNSGVDKVVSVRSHRRSVYVNAKTGRRVSAKEVALDKKRKNKRVAEQLQNVASFERHQKTPQREWFDIRHPVDEDIVQTAISDVLERRGK